MGYVAQRRSGIMLCYPFTERRLTDQKFGWYPPYYLQPKLNGHRARCLWTPEKTSYLVSSEVNTIPGVPHINQEIDRLGIADVELDGELYCHGMSLEEVSSIVSRQVNLHPRYFDMEYYIFDLVLPVSQEVRTAALERLFDRFKEMGVKHLKMVPTYKANTVNEVMKLYDQFIENGYEGFVIRERHAPYMRKRSVYVMKFKPKAFDVYPIIGTVQEHDIYGVPKESLGSIVCRGSDGTPFNVGTGYDRDQRVELWKIRNLLPGMFLKIGYQNLTAANRVPYAARFVEILTEYVEPENPDFQGGGLPETSIFDIS